MKDAFLVNPGVHQEFDDLFGEAVHLLSASNCTSRSLVGLTALLLGIGLSLSNSPEFPDRIGKNQTACGHPTLKDGVCFGPHALTPGFMESRNRQVFAAQIHMTESLLSVAPEISSI